MNEPRHTPGPWTVVEIPGESGSARTEWSRLIVESGKTLAIVSSRQTETERDANARLIAAAPDLLMAIRVLVWQTEIHPMPNGGAVCCDAIRQSQIAIDAAMKG